jgi:cyclopropane-fatty-acyl-phospholipid synthase
MFTYPAPLSSFELDTRHIESTIRILNALFEGYSRDFTIRLWNDQTIEPTLGEHSHFTLVLCHPGAMRVMLLTFDEVSMGEAYVYNDIDVEGDIDRAFAAVYYITEQKRSFIQRARLLRDILSLPDQRLNRDGLKRPKLSGSKHSKQRDKEAITYHYDMSNDFYAQWLGSTMAYTCGIYNDPSEDLDIAQVRKFDAVAQKLELKPDDRMLDIGCGWGGLVLHAARSFGVRATGITLSEQQAAYANEKIHKLGLQDRCKVVVMDYRDVSTESFDKISSIEMFEAVGEKQLPIFFAGIHRLLQPGGKFLLQGICDHYAHRASRSNTFGQIYCFPDHEIVPISSAMSLAEAAGLEMRNVECLRESYVLTLQAWLNNLQKYEAQVLQFVSPAAHRAYKLYIAGLIRSFRIGHHTVHQVLMQKA